HMVGGKPQEPINEHIFSFAFPEYPGALMHFLTKLGEQWNITLFHYRNHGAAEGLVLAGFDIDDNKRSLFDLHVSELGFDMHEHQDNPAYRLVLSGQN
ncbi:MAG: threonine ammonia-lyase, biosynthetic, partial [Glaciecola sp.]